jgi:hypothetical protein
VLELCLRIDLATSTTGRAGFRGSGDSADIFTVLGVPARRREGECDNGCRAVLDAAEPVRASLGDVGGCVKGLLDIFEAIIVLTDVDFVAPPKTAGSRVDPEGRRGSGAEGPRTDELGRFAPLASFGATFSSLCINT